MLPGDYILMKMSEKVQTSPQALSEAVLWDYQNNYISYKALESSEISIDLVPELVYNFTNQAVTSQ